MPKSPENPDFGMISPEPDIEAEKEVERRAYREELLRGGHFSFPSDEEKKERIATLAAFKKISLEEAKKIINAQIKAASSPEGKEPKKEKPKKPGPDIDRDLTKAKIQRERREEAWKKSSKDHSASI